MASPVWILTVLLSVLAVQGLESAEDALNSLQEMEDEIETHFTGLRLLIDGGKDQLMAAHDLEVQESNARMERHKKEVLLMAAQSRCRQGIDDRLDVSLDNRFENCINLTEKVVEFERLGQEIYLDFSQGRPIFCDAVNNITLCRKIGGMFSDITCFYTALEAYKDQFDTVKSEIIGVITKIHELALRTLDDFKGCFMSNEKTLIQENLQILESECEKSHPKDQPLIKFHYNTQ